MLGAVIAMRGRILRSFLALAAAVAVSTVACTSTETSSAVIAPTAEKCQIAAASAPTVFPAGGGQGTLTVTANRDCTWSVATNAAWVSIATVSGQGDASIPYAVSANPVPSSRSATVIVGSQTIQLSQSPAPCRYAWTPASSSIGFAGGRLDVNLDTLTGCGWTASSDSPWVRIASASSGNAASTITLQVDANAGDPRAAHVSAGGAVFALSQQGAPPPTPPPAPPPPPEPVQVDGTIVALSGKCPNVIFVVATSIVTTDRDTIFRKGDCDDLKTGRGVTVTGTPQPDKTVYATRIDLKKDDNSQN
jgi:hypothetical protein